MNNRTILTGFAVLVLGGVIALIVALARGGNDTATGAAVAPADRAVDEPARAAADPGARPALEPAGRGAALPDEHDGPTVFMTDGGVLVRDHRSDRSKPPPLDNLPPPRNAPRKMETSAIYAVRGALRNVVRKCESAMPADGAGANPRLQAVVTVTVENEVLTAGAMEISGSDIVDVDAIATCVRDGFAGATVPVPGQADIVDFKLTHPFRLQR